MKISTKKLRKLIQEELFYREFYNADPTLKEFWGKKKEQTSRRSDADILEQALQVMTQSTESFSEGNGLNYVIWGPFDDPYDKELMKLGQAFTKRLKEVAAEYRAKEDQRDQE
jgi:hypothetical protein